MGSFGMTSRDRGQDRRIAAMQRQLAAMQNGGGDYDEDYYDDGAVDSDSTITRALELAPRFFEYIGLQTQIAELKKIADSVKVAPDAIKVIAGKLYDVQLATLDGARKAILCDMLIKGVMWYITYQNSPEAEEGGGLDSPVFVVLFLLAIWWYASRPAVTV